MLEGYWEVDGEGFVINEVQWSSSGAKGIYFLHLMDVEMIFRPVDSYGRLLYDDKKVPDGPSGVEPDEAGAWADIKAGELDDLGSALPLVKSAIAQVEK
jgi:hypothetical protein